MDQAITIPRLISRYILLNDIVASSRLMEQYPVEFNALLDRHNQLFLTTCGDFGGEIFKNTGDGYYVFFESFNECVAYAHELAKQFAEFPTIGEDERFQVGIAIHAGEIRPSVTQYFGPALNRASRLCAICHPGQILISGNAVPGDPELPEGLALSDLGLHHLRDLGQPEQLYQLYSPELKQTQFPALETLNNRPNNLFEQPNAFIGREAEIGQLTGLLDKHRLISIIAPGGYGKSRLAAHLCADLLPAFERGVFFVELASIPDHKGITTAISNATGFQFFGKGDPKQQIIDFLRNKEMLLCFDNFEHVLEGATFVGDILKEASKVKLLVTSREPLRITGEQVYPLEPLPVSKTVQAGSWDLDAVALFADRASLVNPAFTLDVNSISGVHTICQRLDGIPLAIELAAAWMDSFSLGELLAELDEQLELTARLIDVPERHRSLRASLDWSWNLLKADRRQMLMAISTFRGGCFPDAASAVTQMKGMKLRGGLARLIDKGWLYTRNLEGKTRFYLRDAATWEYAFEKLQASHGNGADSIYEQTVMAHTQYFSALVDREGPRLEGDGTPTGQKEAFVTFEIELENIIEAMDSLLQRNGSSPLKPNTQNLEHSFFLLLPIARWLWRYLSMKGKSRELHDTYCRLGGYMPADANTELSFWALYGLGDACWRLGKLEDAIRHAKTCLKLAKMCSTLVPGSTSVSGGGAEKDTRRDADATAENKPTHAEGDATVRAILEAYALHLQGILHREQGRIDEARECYEASLAIRREMGDRRGEGYSLNNLGFLHSDLGRMEEAREYLEASMAIRHQFGDRRGEGISFNNLGTLHMFQGKMDEARECYEASLDIFREIGNRYGEGNSLNNLSVLHLKQGRIDEARECYETSLAIEREIGDRSGEGYSLNHLGALHLNQGQIDEAREYFEASLAIRREIGDRLGEGHSLNNLGTLHMYQGRMDEARECYEASMAIMREISNLHGEGGVRDSYAGLLLATGELDRACEMLAECQRISEELDMKNNLALLHPKWARYWLLVFGSTTAGSTSVPGGEEIQSTFTEKGATGENKDTRRDAGATLTKALHHLDLAKGYCAEIGGTWETEEGQEITTARRAIIEFAEKHGLADRIADLIAEQQAEDAGRTG